MQYFIGINQRAFSEISKQCGIKLDLTDATIVDFVAKFAHTGELQTKIINERVFYWVSYQKIIDENPMLEINNTEVIGRRIAKLKEAQIFEIFVDKKDNSKTYINFGENYRSIINWQEVTTQKSPDPTPDDSKVANLTTQKSDNQRTNDQSISLSNTTAQKIENQGWKTEILNHPLFPLSQNKEFPNLDDSDISYTLELYKVSLTNGRQPHFTQAVSWLKNASLDKIKTEKIKASPAPKTYQSNSYSQNNYKDQSASVPLQPKHIWQEDSESDHDFEERCEFESTKSNHRIEKHYSKKQEFSHDTTNLKGLKAKLFKEIA